VASIDKRNGRWRARWRTPDGKSRSLTFDTKTAAQHHLTTVEHSKQTGGYVDASAGRVSFSEFAAAWLDAQTFDESTREAVALRIRVHMEPTFGRMQLRAIQPSTVQNWLRAQQATSAPRYVAVQLANLSAILGAAVEDGRIARNPVAARSVKAPRVAAERIVPWSAEQVAAVIEAHPTTYSAIPVVAAGAGLRQGEVFGLRRQDIDFLGRTLRIRQQVKIVGNKVITTPPKGGKVRDVPMADAVSFALAERIRLHPPGSDDLVFVSRERNPLNRNHFNRYVWKPALQQAGVEPTRANGMHALRHYYASVLLDAGESIRALADYLGHSDPGFTLRVYTHLMPASEDRARKAIDAAFARSSQPEGAAESV
jgi:integrase